MINENILFEQFTMFNLIPVTNNILYWNNSLSYSDLIPNFIEWIDSHENSYTKISKWENNKKRINIDLLKNTTGSDLLDKRILYVVNSFIMAFEMCFERYCQQLNINEKDYHLDIKNMIIDKNQKIILKDNSVSFYIIANINDNFDNGEIFFSERNMLSKPQAASVFIVPVSEFEKYEIKDNTSGTRYIAYAPVYKNNMEVQN